ncbi:MAG: tRNA (adenosine(37)-N6)-dimethylallyltransferase MiaA [Candidatus Sulfobium sp.]|jgi:tRNA dimethylallyltransferase
MKKVLILLGPTGAGKTGASILLAEALDTEIISADSMQIYRGMDAGTAKPTREERKAIRHHMIDVADPSGSFSAGRYIEEIVPVIDGLHKEGRIPLIVGGTGLYIKAVTRGIFSGPPADWDLREELLSLEENNRGALYSWLREVDPRTAEKIEQNDTRRVLRALEVCLKSRRKMSFLQETLTRPLPYDFIKIGLTRERKELYRIINERVDAMFREGLVAEVERLLALHPDRAPMQAIGYKELFLYLNGTIAKKEAADLIKRNTRRYAKRQFTWFRREEGIEWVDITGIYDSRSVFAKIKSVLEALHPGVLK